MITDRLVLRQFNMKDADDVFVWTSNPENGLGKDEKQLGGHYAKRIS